VRRRGREEREGGRINKKGKKNPKEYGLKGCFGENL